jgi:hypothetical protein
VHTPPPTPIGSGVSSAASTPTQMPTQGLGGPQWIPFRLRQATVGGPARPSSLALPGPPGMPTRAPVQRGSSPIMQYPGHAVAAGGSPAPRGTSTQTTAPAPAPAPAPVPLPVPVPLPPVDTRDIEMDHDPVFMRQLRADLAAHLEAMITGNKRDASAITGLMRRARSYCTKAGLSDELSLHLARRAVVESMRMTKTEAMLHHELDDDAFWRSHRAASLLAAGTVEHTNTRLAAALGLGSFSTVLGLGCGVWRRCDSMASSLLMRPTLAEAARSSLHGYWPQVRHVTPTINVGIPDVTCALDDLATPMFEEESGVYLTLLESPLPTGRVRAAITNKVAECATWTKLQTAQKWVAIPGWVKALTLGLIAGAVGALVWRRFSRPRRRQIGDGNV